MSASTSPATLTPAEALRLHFDVLASGGNAVELRAFLGGKPRSGYFDNRDDFATAALDATDRGATGVFATVNPPMPAVLARGLNRLAPAKRGGTTKDDEIELRLVLPIDLDAVRPAGVSATGAEKAETTERARAVMRRLRAEGWPDPLALDSGNGAHLYYPVALPADDGGVVARVLRRLDAEFSDDAVHVDPAVCNASRILKTAGTWARKGDDTTERPHRRAAFLSVPTWATLPPSERPALSRKQLEAFAPVERTNAEQSGTGDVPAAERVRSALAAIAAQGRPDRDVWIRASAAALAAVDGDRGHAEALLIKAFGEETPGEYKPVLSSNWRGITAGTLFHLAKDAGWKPGTDRARSEAPHDKPRGAPGDGAETPGGVATAIPARVYDLLPDTFRRACDHFEAWHERDVFLTSLVGTLSAALPGVRFRYGRTARYLSPHLYFFLLANGAGGKGVADFAFSWLDKIDERLDAESREAHDAWSRARDLYERSKKARDGGTQAQDPGPEPVARFVVGGDDTTLGGLYDGLHANPAGLAVLSTEADALSGSNRREFGGFSYLLRKSFHHERATESRRGTGRRTVKKPRLAVVVTGTFDQFGRLLESVQDGLYSRFAVYAFDTPGGFESQRPSERADDTTDFMAARAADVDRLWRTLESRGDDRPLYVDVSAELWARVDAAFRALDRALYARPGVSPYLAATVKRGALIAFRIASVLAVWRAFDAGASLGTMPRVEASADDVDAAVLLATTYAEHALAQAAAHGGERAAEADMGGDDRMTGLDRTFLDALPQEFGRAEMQVAAAAAGFSEPTAYRRVRQWVDGGLLRKRGQGAYAKKGRCEDCETENDEKTPPCDSRTQEAVFSGFSDSHVSQAPVAGDGTTGQPPDLAAYLGGTFEDEAPPAGEDPF